MRTDAEMAEMVERLRPIIGDFDGKPKWLPLDELLDKLADVLGDMFAHGTLPSNMRGKDVQERLWNLLKQAREEAGRIRDRREP